MSNLDVLRDITGRLQPPGYDDLIAVVRKRRRRSALGAAAGAAVTVLAVVMSGAALSGDQRAQLPAQDPSPTQTASPSTSQEWTPERTRAEGSPVEFLAHRRGPAPSGLDAQLYCIGEATPTGSPCDNYHPYDPDEDQHWALEVTQGARSALFDVQGSPSARDIDEDSILVQDGTARAPRFRLLQADGTAVQLRVVSDLAPAAPGPDVVLIQEIGVYRSGMIGPDGSGEHPYLVDDRAGTLQLLDVPEEIAWWGPNVDEFLWGGNGCRVIWQRPDGSFDHHDVDCQDSAGGLTDPGWNFVGFDDWAETGRLALVEYDSEESFPRVAHVSLNRGATWQRIPVELRDTDLLAGWSLVTSQIG